MLVERIEQQENVFEQWSALQELIGSADGKKFRNIVQQMNLELMVAHANRQLVKMTDRYVLEVGNVAMENTAANLLADASVREAYLGG